MAVVRSLFPAFAGALLIAGQLGAQGPTGTIGGRVIDSTSSQPLANVNVYVEGTDRRTQTRTDGSFILSQVPAGTHVVRARRIGYATRQHNANVTDGGTVTLEFALLPQAAALGEIVVTGYGTQRREAITGSVSTIDAVSANVGVQSNATTLMQGRVAGVQIVQNNGEPGAGSQIRIRGGTSISGGNDPLYVIDGVPIQNVQTEASGIGIGGSPSLARDPLNLINPSDIQSITILKDASATAIYGARAANGVILIETKKGSLGSTAMEYDSYIASSSQSRYLDLLSAGQYRSYVASRIAAGDLRFTTIQAGLGAANTDWQREVTRSATTQNHNLSFTGGSRETRYRASLNYMNQNGVALSSGFERFQGRVNGNHSALNDKLRLGLNLTSSHINNDYLPFENTGGFEGGVFVNMVNFNPTQPVMVPGPTGGPVYYELGAGPQSTRNPVAIAQQIDDVASTTRTLGNLNASYDLLSNLTAQFTIGVDRSEGTRRSYLPNASPVGASLGGQARQVQRDNMSLTLQTLLMFNDQFATDHDVEVIGGYEFNDYDLGEFGAEARGFLTDAFSFNNLGGGSVLVRPFSWREESRLVSFFSRANYGFRDKYFLTGVVRYDGSSKFGEGNKWALFPAVSASWRVSAEEFMRDKPFSDLRLRAGYGLQGNPAVPAYASLILLETGARYPFGDVGVTGVAPTRNPNPNLKWEQTEQVNFAVDFGFRDDQLKGTLEYYVKNTKDLLQTVDVPQPASVSTRLENVGKVRNTGVEFSLDAVLVNRANLNWSSGLVFTAEKNKVIDLGPRTSISTGDVSGEGQSDQKSQSIMPGYALGTFFGLEYAGVDALGRQLFNDYDANGALIGTTRAPGGEDRRVIGDANPDFTLGLNTRADWGRFDFSMLIRSEIGKDVFNNTALVYSTKSNALQSQNFFQSALSDPVAVGEPAIFSSRWIENASFIRLQNLTVGYTLPTKFVGQARSARVYLSGDNLLLSTDYSGYDPEVHVDAGLASRGIDYLVYPRARTFTAGVRLAF